MIDKKFDELRLTGALPSPSTVGLKVLEITRSDDFDFDELVRTIMADPALSGRIIKLANASTACAKDPIETVPTAAIRLGAERVRSIALGFTLIESVTAGRQTAFDHNIFWARSLAVALAANAFANETEIHDPTEAFTCGLISDIGSLALACVHPERYSAILEGAPDATGEQLAAIELQAFAIDHYSVTVAMMKDWRLPKLFGEAVMVHESSREIGGLGTRVADLAALLRLGKYVADLLMSAPDANDLEWVARFGRFAVLCEQVKVPRDRALAICDEIGTSWEDWGRVMGLDCRLPIGFREMSERLEGITFDEPTVRATGKLNVRSERFAKAFAAPGLDGPGEVAELEDAQASESTRILLIDDDANMVKLLAHKLSKEGFDVMTATDSVKGLQMAMAHNPQIVITDWMMPGMTGVKLCSTLRASDAGKRMYIVIVTARDDDDRVVEAFDSGADDYIPKPFNPRVLLARVRAGQRMIRMREKVEAAERERLRQVAELGILTRKLRAAAFTDALTELPNRRYAMRRLKQEWDAGSKVDRPISVVMMDIDNFKAINDSFGHDVGDVVLKQVARHLRLNARSGDILCRLGGEEFLSINVNCAVNAAMRCAERLRSAVEKLEIVHGGRVHRVTISLGVAQRSSEHETVDDLIKIADNALYMAKASGRNRAIKGDASQADAGRRPA